MYTGNESSCPFLFVGIPRKPLKGLCLPRLGDRSVFFFSPFCRSTLSPSPEPVVFTHGGAYWRYDPRALRVPPKLTPCDVKSFFSIPETPGRSWWRHGSAYTHIHGTGTCGLVFKGLKLSPNVIVYTHTLARTAVLLHTPFAEAIIVRLGGFLCTRARVHPARRNPFTYDICWKITAATGVKGEEGDWQAARQRPGGFVFSKGGHVDTCIKVPNLNLGSFATICPSLIELSIDSVLQQPSILSLLMLPTYKCRYAYTQFDNISVRFHVKQTL